MKKLIIALSVISLFISCGHNISAKEKTEAVTMSEMDRPLSVDTGLTNGIIGNETDSVATPQQNSSEKREKNQQESQERTDWDKKIIKNATLNLEVKDFNAYNLSLREKFKLLGGYVAQEEQTQSEYKIENTITIKVPVEFFDEAVNLLTKDVKSVNEKKITSQDVTTEVVDTKSRMEAKKQVRLRYLDLLKQARNMEEILNVQKEINGIQEEIESSAGRIAYLTHSSAFSTIQLTFYQVLNASAINDDHPNFANRLSSAFRNGWSWVGELFIGLISIWPLLLMGFVAFIIFRRSRKSSVKQQPGISSQ